MITNIILAVIGVLSLLLNVYLVYKNVKDTARYRLSDYKLNWIKIVNVQKRINEISVIKQRVLDQMSGVDSECSKDVTERKNYISEIIKEFDREFSIEKRVSIGYIKCLDIDIIITDQDGKKYNLPQIFEAFNDVVAEIANAAISQAEIKDKKLYEYETLFIKYYYELGQKLVLS